MIEVEFTKTTLLIKGSIAKFNLDLAYQLYQLKKWQKKEVKEIKSKNNTKCK
jgi:hypothetical protein